MFYRQSGRGGHGFESVGKLIAAIRSSQDHVLVVVEDAVRPATDAIYDVIDEFERTHVEVSFLLDARRGELEGFADPTGMETGAEDTLREVVGHIERYDVPAFDPDDPAECRCIIERFETKTGRAVTHSAAYIHQEVVQSEAELGELVYLTYFLPVGGEEAVGLESDVRAKHRTVLDPTGEKSQREELADFDTNLLRDVGLLVNLLNTSGIGIHPELVHAVGHVHGNDQETHTDIQDIRAAFAGWMLYPQQDEASNVKQTTHELWSALYLRHVALRYGDVGDEGFERGAKERFEDCVNALFRLCDDEEQRQAISRGFGDSEVLDALADTPEPMADDMVRDIFEVGEQGPILAPLYGTSDESELVLPSVCSRETNRDSRIRRGNIHWKSGAYEAARTSYESTRALSEELDDSAGLANSLNGLGLVAEAQGEYEAARAYHEDSLEIAEELGDRAGIAISLNNLGAVAHQQGEYKAARAYHEDSLEIAEELGDRAGIATSLNNLGLVARQQGEYEAARTYHERYVSEFIEIGAVRRALTGLENLIRACEELGLTEEALEWCATAFALIEESDIEGIKSEAGRFRLLRAGLSGRDP